MILTYESKQSKYCLINNLTTPWPTYISILIWVPWTNYYKMHYHLSKKGVDNFEIYSIKHVLVRGAAPCCPVSPSTEFGYRHEVFFVYSKR